MGRLWNVEVTPAGYFRQVRVCLSLLYVVWYALFLDAASAEVKTLYSESFEGTSSPAWRYYDSSLDFRDLSPRPELTFAGSTGALLGEGNSSTQSFTMLARNISLSVPIREDVYLTFACYCQADVPADDEIWLQLESCLAPNGQRFQALVPLVVAPKLNRWQLISVPLSAVGQPYVGGMLDGVFRIIWHRGKQDTHTLAIDELRFSEGTETQPRLVAARSFQMLPYGLTVEDDRYIESIQLHARFLKNCDWNLELINDQGDTLRHFHGKGRDIEMVFDGRQQDGQLIGGGKISARLEVRAADMPERPVLATTNVTVHGGPASLLASSDQVLLVVEKQIDYDRRTASDNIVGPGQLPAYRLPKEPLHLKVAQGRRAGFQLKVVDHQSSHLNLQFQTSDLVSTRGEVIPAEKVRFQLVRYLFGVAGEKWRTAEPCDRSLEQEESVANLELSVSVPANAAAETYHGEVTIGLTQLALTVTVVPRAENFLFWHDQKAKIMLAKPQVMPRREYFLEGTQGFQEIAEAGFQLMIPYVGIEDHQRMSQRAGEFELMALARTHAPAYPRDDLREPVFVWQNGVKSQLFCPYAKSFWDESMIPDAVKLARYSLSTPLIGMEYDFEIYGPADKKFAHIYTHCYCDACWQAHPRTAGKELPPLEPKRRHSWLVKQQRLGEYKMTQDERLRREARRFVKAVHDINPDLHFMLLAWGDGHFLEVLASEFGSPRVPVILATESTYGRGNPTWDMDRALANNTLICQYQIRHAKRVCLDSLYVPGVMPGYRRADPEFCRQNAMTLSRYGDGYWVFFQQLEAPSTVAENMAAFRAANRYIDEQPGW